jgi:hypothetical protein
MEENSRKNCGGKKSNLEHLSVLQLFQIFTDFELFKRFQAKPNWSRFVLILAYCSFHCNSSSNLDQKSTMVIYTVCTINQLTCMTNNPKTKKILNFQTCYL